MVTNRPKWQSLNPHNFDEKRSQVKYLSKFVHRTNNRSLSSKVETTTPKKDCSYRTLMKVLFPMVT